MKSSKLTLGQLRALIREVAMSPSLAKASNFLKSPLDSDSVNKHVQGLKQSFGPLLERNLVLYKWRDSYDSSTRDFNDSEYEAIKSIVSEAQTTVERAVNEALTKVWKQAHNSTSAKKKAA